MKFVRFIFENKKVSFSVPFEKAQAILSDQEQVILITDKDGNWTGETINKAHLVATEPDLDAEKEWNQDQIVKIEPTKQDNENREKIRAEIDRVSEHLRMTGVLRRQPEEE